MAYTRTLGAVGTGVYTPVGDLRAFGIFTPQNFDGLAGSSINHDCTTGLQAMAAAMTAGSRALFSPGFYPVSGSVTFTVPCVVEAVGTGTPQSGSDVGAVIVDRNGNTSPFVVSASNVTIRGLYFINYGTVSNINTNQCAAVTFTTGNDHVVEGCHFTGWWKWLWFKSCAAWRVERNWFQHATLYGIHIQNTGAVDSGDQVLAHNQMLSNGPNWNASALVRQESGGGMKVIGNKLFVTNHTPGADIGLDLAVADGASTSILLVEGNSFEHLGTSAIRITQAGPSNTGTFEKIDIVGNQFSCFYMTGPAISIATGSGTPSHIRRIGISSNIFDGDTTTHPSAFIGLTAVDRVAVDGNYFDGGPVGVNIDKTATNVTVTNSNSYTSVAIPVQGLRMAQPNGLPPSGAFTADVPIPTGLTATPATSGGSLADGTYYYRVAYFDAATSTGLACAEVSATVSGGGGSGRVTLSWATWPAVGSTSRAKVFRGTSSGAQSVGQTVTTAAGGASTLSDTGSGWTAATVPVVSGFSAINLPSTFSTAGGWLLTGYLGIGTRFPASTLELGGSLGLRRDVTAGDITLTAGHCVMAYTTLSTPRTVTLPTAVGINSRVYIVKDETGNAATNNITVQGTSSQTIDGSTTKVISTAYGVLRLYSNGANWFTW